MSWLGIFVEELIMRYIIVCISDSLERRYGLAIIISTVEEGRWSEVAGKT